MSRLIDADELKDAWWNPETGMGDIIANLTDELDLNDVEDDVMAFSRKLLEIVNNFVDTEPTVDAVEVVRCKDCIWYHKAHVECNDGTEKDESEFPDEAFGILGRKCGVTIEYGINVGGTCENKFLFVNDEYQFRRLEDYCSRGERKDGAK